MHNILEHIVISELWKDAQKACVTEKCRRLVRMILTSNSLREALVYYIAAYYVAASPDIPDVDVEEFIKIANACVTDNIVQQMVTAAFLEDDEWAQGLMGTIFECIDEHTAEN